MPILDPDGLRRAMTDLPEWVVRDGALERTVTGEDFNDSIALVNRIARIADEANHHPDIDIRWSAVTIRLSTHSEGGITSNDTALAQRIDGLVA